MFSSKSSCARCDIIDVAPHVIALIAPANDLSSSIFSATGTLACLHIAVIHAQNSRGCDVRFCCKTSSISGACSSLAASSAAQTSIEEPTFAAATAYPSLQARAVMLATVPSTISLLTFNNFCGREYNLLQKCFRSIYRSDAPKLAAQRRF